MALFDVFCADHGVQEVMSRDSSALDCPVCGRRVERLYSSPPTFKCEFSDGFDMGLGRSFYSQRERDNYIDRRGIKRRRG
jgi:hypothetical protein